MRIHALSLVIALFIWPLAQAQDCEGLISQLEAAVGDASDRDQELLNFVSELRVEAVAHLENGDPESCEAAVRQALELLEAQ